MNTVPDWYNADYAHGFERLRDAFDRGTLDALERHHAQLLLTQARNLVATLAAHGPGHRPAPGYETPEDVIRLAMAAETESLAAVLAALGRYEPQKQR